MHQRSEFYTGCRPKCRWPESCTLDRVNYTICGYHNISCIFRCCVCNHYHICDGGDECVVINTGESLVCMLTGSCLTNEIQDYKNLVVRAHKALEKKPDGYTLQCVLQAVKRDIVNFFSNAESVLNEVKNVILLNNETLTHDIEKLIDLTYSETHQLFSTCEYGYNIICSMYIQIIISIYSSKTIYNNLLFKCTKNKKYDTILKRMRELWMSTLTTGSSVLKHVTS
ncbi:ORF31 [Felid gammaherpesvirus 1]|uniref:ORF31 n=1 Tax=Felid gammaherpesvirus 1 TaxID=2560468 RepID=A0A0M4M4H6_9GAMA|nr:ORF31 [Felis catus gammaherpesvirus 1]ALE14743.1 ORF31 [Felis catus gammaherpesvirus 1]